MSEWISTKDKLPKELSKVDILINGQRRIVDVEYTNKKFYAFPPISKEHWAEIKNNVTHWMLVPELPRAE